MRYHFLRQVVESGEILLQYLKTANQVADALTKGVTREANNKFAEAMGLRKGA